MLEGETANRPREVHAIGPAVDFDEGRVPIAGVCGEQADCFAPGTGVVCSLDGERTDRKEDTIAMGAFSEDPVFSMTYIFPSVRLFFATITGAA